MLRASLLQPLTDVGSLNMRYDAVQELLREGEELAFDVGNVGRTSTKLQHIQISI